MQGRYRLLGWIAGGLAGLALLGTVAMMIAARLAPEPDTLGVRDGQLAPCPPTPNCVATQSDDPAKRMAPLAYNGTRGEAQQRLLSVLQEQPRMTLLAVEDNYIHALFRSPTMGFPDDVEFYFDDTAQVIHYRAAARMGQSDLGVNQARMERIAAAFGG